MSSASSRDWPSVAQEVEVDEFQGKYSNAEQSRWNITIVDGANQLDPFELTE